MDSKDLKKLYEKDPVILALLCMHKSPENENSFAKNIPIKCLFSVKKLGKIIPISIKYRGKRRPGSIGQATCLRKDATSFAIYHRK